MFSVFNTRPRCRFTSGKLYGKTSRGIANEEPGHLTATGLSAHFGIRPRDLIGYGHQDRATGQERALTSAHVLRHPTEQGRDTSLTSSLCPDRRPEQKSDPFVHVHHHHHAILFEPNPTPTSPPRLYLRTTPPPRFTLTPNTTSRTRVPLHCCFERPALRRKAQRKPWKLR